MNKYVLDAGIPVLTEVIAAPQQAMPPRHAIEPSAATAPDTVVPAELEGWIEDEWNRMARQISGQILQQLMTRLDSAIEQQVRDSLADVLQTAVERMAAEIKHNLQHSLEQVIADAVSDEVSRIQSLEK